MMDNSRGRTLASGMTWSSSIWVGVMENSRGRTLASDIA